VNPRVPTYAPEPLLMLAHVMFGACLGPMIGRTLPKRGREPKETIEVSASPRMDGIE